MADARSLVAALAMGAAGMNMGTRFIATKEAPVHQNVKDALVKASELDTRLVMRALRNTERVLNNKGVEHLLEIERAKGKSLKIDDIHEQVAGVYPKVMIDGDMDAGAWSCGMVVGLIHDIPTVKEAIGVDHLAGAWRAVVGPKGMPPEAVAKLSAAIEKIHQSKEFRDFMNSRGFGLDWRKGADFERFLETNFNETGEVVKAVGLAKKG